MPHPRRGPYNKQHVVSFGWYHGHATVELADPRQRHNPDSADDWRYADTGAPTPENALSPGEERPCAACGRRCAWGEPDPCLGWLPGVRNACCGHGVDPGAYGGIEEEYVQLADGRELRGAEAHAYFLAQGCTPPPRPPRHPAR